MSITSFGSTSDAGTRPPGPATVAAPRLSDEPDWLATHRADLEASLSAHGAVLVRGLELADPDEVGTAFHAVSTALMNDVEPFAERHRYAEGVYSSSAWPAGQPMCLHQESSYAARVPGRMLFACLQPGERGGATGLADAAAVLEAIPADLLERFERQGWMLLRSYQDEIGASIADSFGSDDPAVVEAYCRAHGIQTQWQPDGGLRTRQRRGAVARHPVTGVRCWFNQVAFLSEWTMDPDVREFLLDSYGPDGLPFTTAFGDGEPVGADVVALLTDLAAERTRHHEWQAGDLLLIDNIRTAHSREPFTGTREILAALTDPVEAASIATFEGAQDGGTR